MGPLTLADYVGLDTTLSILRNWRAAHPNEAAFFVPPLLERLVTAGRLGRKSGAGFYEWKGNTPGAPLPLPPA
jgi:3-hydroxyacyl-CoA dehydrogenase